jgi:hypothetical protein
MTSSEFTTVAEGGGVGVAFCGILDTRGTTAMNAKERLARN